MAEVFSNYRELRNSMEAFDRHVSERKVRNAVVFMLTDNLVAEIKVLHRVKSCLT